MTPDSRFRRDAVRVMVVDGQDLFRTGLVRLLSEMDGLDVVYHSRRGEDALQRVAQLRPDVVVLEMDLPGLSGPETARGLRALAPDIAMLVLTTDGAEEQFLTAVRAGATGYLLKDTPVAEIVRGIHAAAVGHAVLDPSVAAGLLARVRTHEPPARESGAQLTPRERDVLALLAAGHATSEIGRRLHLSTSTIKHHLAGTLSKLGAANRVQAAVIAVREGLLDEASAA